MEAVREEEVKLRGVGFVKEVPVGFKPGVKERGSGFFDSRCIRMNQVYGPGAVVEQCAAELVSHPAYCHWHCQPGHSARRAAARMH